MDAPFLPREYELHRHAVVDDVVAAAAELAVQGAEEGTLLWALRQAHGGTRNGAPWQSSGEDLHLALILRPECDRETALQLVFVGALSLGAVLAETVSPMVALHYRWPDDVLLAHARVANFRLAAQAGGEGFAWLVLGLNANVKAVPEGLDFSAAAIEPDGECETTREALLEGFSRYFLRTINHWAEAGFSPILNAWRQRAAGLGEFRRMRVGRQELSGVLAQVRDDGAAVLETDAGSEVVPLGRFFDLDGVPRAR